MFGIELWREKNPTIIYQLVDYIALVIIVKSFICMIGIIHICVVCVYLFGSKLNVHMYFENTQNWREVKMQPEGIHYGAIVGTIL